MDRKVDMTLRQLMALCPKERKSLAGSLSTREKKKGKGKEPDGEQASLVAFTGWLRQKESPMCAAWINGVAVLTRLWMEDLRRTFSMQNGWTISG